MRLPQTRREKEIWHACETLWQQQPDLKKLTGDAIRAQLLALHYKKGSPNEVYRYRRTWQETRGVPDNAIDTTAALSAPALPDPINRAVSLVRDEIFSEAQQTLEKMTVDFDAERVLYENKIKTLQEQLDSIQAYNQKLHEDQKHLEDLNTAQNQEKCLLTEEITQLVKENQSLEKSLLDKAHEHALALEKVAHKERQVILLTESSEKQLQLLKETMEQHEINLIKQLEQQHATQIAQYQEAQLTLKDLMETQRHQWIQQLDAEKTAHKKVLFEKEKLCQSLDKSTQELVSLKEKSIQYEALMEIQQLQANLLSGLSEEIRNLEKTISLDKIAALFEHQTKGASHYISENLQTHFQKQNEWLINILQHPINTKETEPSA